jgi:hypothetical protein
LPIKWLIRRVADFNRRLRFSLTPKNFRSKGEDSPFELTYLSIIPDNRCRGQSIPLGGTVGSSENRESFSGYEADALVNSGKGLLGKLVGLVGSAG